MAKGPRKVATGAKFDWYPWYVQDWQTDEQVRFLNAEQQGCYRALLDHQWIEGSIPADIEMIDALLPRHQQPIAELWVRLKPFFTEAKRGTKRLVNSHLDAIRQQQVTYHNERVRTGKAGAKARWQQQDTPPPPVDSSPMGDPQAELEISDGKEKGDGGRGKSGTTKRKTWLTVWDNAWKRPPPDGYGASLFQRGSQRNGEAPKLIRAVHEDVAEEIGKPWDDADVKAEALSRFKRWIRATPAKYATTLHGFAKTHGSYRAERKPGRKPAAKSPLRPEQA